MPPHYRPNIRCVYAHLNGSEDNSKNSNDQLIPPHCINDAVFTALKWREGRAIDRSTVTQLTGENDTTTEHTNISIDIDVGFNFKAVFVFVTTATAVTAAATSTRIALARFRKLAFRYIKEYGIQPVSVVIPSTAIKLQWCRDKSVMEPGKLKDTHNKLFINGWQIKLEVLQTCILKATTYRILEVINDSPITCIIVILNGIKSSISQCILLHHKTLP